MPFPVAAAITAGAALLGQGANAYSTGRMNKRAERFSREMYSRQRADALSDWNMQNAYNDPSAQMQRLKSAGLNPNLVYGNGADAQMGAPMRSSSQSTPNYRVPQMDLGSVVFNALQAKQLQSNIARTDAETASIMARTTEQNYRNMAFTPELFTKELEAKIDSLQSGAYSSRMSGDLSSERADIANLEMENMNLIAGRVGGSNRQSSMQMKGMLNGYFERFKVEVSSMMNKNLQTGQAIDNMKLQHKLMKFEADLIDKLGVNQTVAGQLLSNFMKIFLLKLK